MPLSLGGLPCKAGMSEGQGEHEICDRGDCEPESDETHLVIQHWLSYEIE